MNLKTIEEIRRLELENEKLKKRVQQLETMLYNETVDNDDYVEYVRNYESSDRE